MRRLLPSGLAAALLVAMAMAAGPAFGFFSTTGSGSALAGISKLSAATITSATPTLEDTVVLSWTAVAPPGSGAVLYSVTRDGGKPAGNCPTTSSPAPVLTCTDNNLALGKYTYVVRAKWRSWSVDSAPSSAEIAVGPVAHLDLKAASTTPAAAAADDLTITAQDANGHTATTYAGAHSLVFSGASASPGGTKPTVIDNSGSAIAFGSATTIDFTAGVAKVSGSKNGVMRLYKSGPTTVEATEGTLAGSPGLELNVSSLAATKLTLAAASTTPTAGVADNLTLTASDTYGNTAAAYTGSTNLTFSGASASPNGDAPTVSNSSGVNVAFGGSTTIAFNAGVASVTGSANGAMKLYKSGTANVKVSDGTLTSAASAVTVAAASAARFTLAAASTTPAAGAADNLTTTALDAYGNTATSYAGLHELTFAGGSASPSGTLPSVVDSSGATVFFGSPTPINFTAGVAKVGAMKNGMLKMSRSGAASVTTSEGAITTLTPLALTVSPGSAAQLAVSSVTISAGALGSPCLFTCSVTGLGNGGTVKAKVSVTDSLGNTAEGIGKGHAAKVTTNGGTIAGTPLAFPAAGPAESATQFTYTAPASGSFSNTITLATSEGTTYTSATLTAAK